MSSNSTECEGAIDCFLLIDSSSGIEPNNIFFLRQFISFKEASSATKITVHDIKTLCTDSNSKYGLVFKYASDTKIRRRELAAVVIQVIILC